MVVVNDSINLKKKIKTVDTYILHYRMRIKGIWLCDAELDKCEHNCEHETIFLLLKEVLHHLKI